MKAWRVILILSAAQFILVLDTTVMNVAISDVVADLDATVTQVQLAITLYMLVMASTMLIGGKLGDILGRRRAFRIGLVAFALGSGITAVAPNIGVLLIGWSVIEGLAAAIMVPALVALIAGNYEGRKRALAYGIIGGVAAAGAAAGPLIGGAVTSAASWRWVFAGEVVIAFMALAATPMIREVARTGPKPKLDLVGAALSIAGLGITVLAVQQSSNWGLLEPGPSPLTIAGTEITPFGLAPTIFVIGLGLLVLLGFAHHSERLGARGGTPLIKVALLGVTQLRAGLTAVFSQQVILLGTFFAIPLYVQIVLGKDAFETGVELLPLSTLMLITALIAPRFSDRLGPRPIIRAGLVALLISTLGLIASIDRELDAGLFSVSLGVMGIGAGLMVSQIGNVIMSSVGTGDSSEAGGLQGTFQNLGGALGTAIVGAVLLSGLTSAFDERVSSNPAISEGTRSAIVAETDKGVAFVPSAQVEAALAKEGLPEAEVSAIVADYDDSQIRALKAALLAIGVFVLVSLWSTRSLPRDPLVVEGPATPAA